MALQSQMYANGLQPQSFPTPFEFANQNLFPLSPEQVKGAKKSYEATARNAAPRPMGSMPQPSTAQVTLDMSPNATPPVIRVVPGNGAVVSFRDLTGAPWPVISYQSFNGTEFQVNQPIAGSNMVSIAALADYANGNVAIVLKDYPTPIVLSILSTQAKNDAKVDIMIPRQGPNAAVAAVPVRAPTSADLTDALYGIVPVGSKPLKVAGATGRAWKTENGEMLLTGALQVLSPMPIQRTGLGDGYYAYRLPLSSVLLVSQGGSERKMTVVERE
jgi:intracellular multiplication protein IcmK